MITYVISQLGRVLRESMTLTTPSPQVTVNETHYVVSLNGTAHHVRRDRVCDCGGFPQCPCPAIPLVQNYLTGGGQRPPGRHESAWPETWAAVPTLCPICDCPTIPDRYLNSRAGPGWRCSLTGCQHFWQVRMNPLRRYLAAHPPEPCYPWNGASPAERQVWLEAHTHLPRVVPSQSNGGTDALDREKKRKNQPRLGAPRARLDTVRLPRGP